LRDALGDGFRVLDDLEAIPRELRGIHPRNPVNRTPEGGVQLELPPRVRGEAPTSKPEYEAAVIDALAATASAAG